MTQPGLLPCEEGISTTEQLGKGTHLPVTLAVSKKVLVFPAGEGGITRENEEVCACGELRQTASGGWAIYIY